MSGDLISPVGPVALMPGLQPVSLGPLTLEPRAASRPLRDADPAAVREAAQQLESYFLNMLLAELREPGLFGDEEDGYFAPSREERFFQQQLDQALGDELARTGQLGLADIIVQQLLPPEPGP